MSPSTAPRPPKPPVPRLDLVQEVEAIPDDESDRDADTSELAAKLAPPPIVVHRSGRLRPLAIAVVAAAVTVLAIVVAFRPWQRIGGVAHAAPAAHAAIAATFAKRAKPAAPPIKATLVAAQKKIVAPVKKAQPVAAPAKPVAKRPAKST